jgi:hypothetical protein
MRFMVIETFTHGAAPVYERVRTQGRSMPEGLTYVDSWIDERGLDRCFQLMETDDPALLERWAESWSDLATFEIVPVISSADASARALA